MEGQIGGVIVGDEVGVGVVGNGAEIVAGNENVVVEGQVVGNGDVGGADGIVVADVVEDIGVADAVEVVVAVERKNGLACIRNRFL